MNILRKAIRRFVNSAIGLWGFEISRKEIKKHNQRQSFAGALSHIKRLGFEPRTVIDVGIAYGTHVLYDAYPKAAYLLVEPLEEFKPCLDRIAQQYENVQYVIAAAGSQAGSRVINVHPDLSGSSFLLECEESNVNGKPRTVPTVILDEICRKKGLKGPYLIKIDVQGAELDVLAGATETLKDTDYVILEVTLFGTFLEGPQFYNIIDFMKVRGFAFYEVLDLNYRPFDGALCQMDIAFVKESGRFREAHFFATREQREEINKSMSKSALAFQEKT